MTPPHHHVHLTYHLVSGQAVVHPNIDYDDAQAVISSWEASVQSGEHQATLTVGTDDGGVEVVMRSSAIVAIVCAIVPDDEGWHGEEPPTPPTETAGVPEYDAVDWDQLRAQTDAEANLAGAE